MSVKAVNFKLEEEKILDMKNVANAFHITMTDVVNSAIDEYLIKLKKDPFFRLTQNVKDASESENEEILNALDSLSVEDLSITSIKRFSV